MEIYNTINDTPDEHVTVIGWLHGDTHTRTYLYRVGNVWYTTDGVPLFNNDNVLWWSLPEESGIQ